MSYVEPIESPTRGGGDAQAIAQIQARADAAAEQNATVVAKALAVNNEVDVLNAAAQRLEHATVRRSLFWFALTTVLAMLAVSEKKTAPLPQRRSRRATRNS